MRSLLPRWGKRKMKDIRRREIIEMLEDVANGKDDGRRQSGQPAPISARINPHRHLAGYQHRLGHLVQPEL